MHPIDQLMAEGLKTGVSPGASLLVARGKKILWNKVYGQAQVKPSRKKLTKATLFDITSLTKPLSTATLFMLAQQEKKVKLTDRLEDFFPKCPHHQITLKNLLNHTSGLPDWKPYYEDLNALAPGWMGTDQGCEWIVRKILEEPLKNKPGTTVTYSDLGYILLGNILEKIYGESLEKIFAKKVAKPLGLKNTFFMPVGTPRYPLPAPPSPLLFAATQQCPWRKKILRGIVSDDNAYAMGGVAGHAGLFSTAGDLHRWLIELDAARRGKSRFLKKETFDLFCAVPKKRDLKKQFFTLGFDTPSEPSSSGKYFSPQSIGHLGYSGCSFWWDATKDFLVILLTNRVHPKRDNDKIKEFRPRIHDIIVKAFKM